MVNLVRQALRPGLDTWLAAVRANDFRILPIADAHLLTYARLLPVKNHRDSFGCLLIAQALTGNLLLVSRDGKFGEYADAGLQTCWA